MNVKRCSTFHNTVKVNIYFMAIGLLDIPTEQQFVDTMKSVEQKKADKFS